MLWFLYVSRKDQYIPRSRILRYLYANKVIDDTAHVALLFSHRMRRIRTNRRDDKMRTEFVECKSRSTAARRCPWAAVIAKVDGGFRCFESRYDYDVWKNQK